MKFNFFILKREGEKDNGKVQAVSFSYKDVEHCSTDFRDFDFEQSSVHFSQTTQKDSFATLMDESVESGFMQKVTVDIPDESIEINESSISGIYFPKEFTPKVS